MEANERHKISWRGTILSIQPRATVWRYELDNRRHFLAGYNLFLSGSAQGEETQFSVAISEKQ